MTSDQLNPTPKTVFQNAQGNIEQHHALLENPAFDRAEHFALLTYTRSIASDLVACGNSPNAQLQAMLNGVKLTAIHEFMHEFRMLAEKPVIVESPGIARTLNHKA